MADTPGPITRGLKMPRLEPAEPSMGWTVTLEAIIDSSKATKTAEAMLSAEEASCGRTSCTKLPRSAVYQHTNASPTPHNQTTAGPTSVPLTAGHLLTKRQYRSLASHPQTGQLYIPGGHRLNWANPSGVWCRGPVPTTYTMQDIAIAGRHPRLRC
ncbi:Hypothetical predicted protein [Pelobates cultripes]|uniref:Uncharacterized protein n=1 Tax=Pelobates cultripes TaxID=61616 RepID=A0AAD1VW31_PELCU|nr:Hypothetical predicted protein [Pelobates cultripes]